VVGINFRATDRWLRIKYSLREQVRGCGESHLLGGGGGGGGGVSDVTNDVTDVSDARTQDAALICNRSRRRDDNRSIVDAAGSGLNRTTPGPSDCVHAQFPPIWGGKIAARYIE